MFREHKIKISRNTILITGVGSGIGEARPAL